MLQNGASYVWDDEMKVPYAIQDDQWVGFDDERSIRHKMKWIKENGFGGAMVWSIDMDDFTGTVCGGDVKFPLIGAMREELRGVSRGKNAKDVDWSKIAGGIEEIEEEIIEKPKPIKISVAEVLNKVRKPTKKLVLKSSASKSGSRNILLYEIRSKNFLFTVRPPQVFCYLTSWSRKRPGAGKFLPEDVNPSLCTHLIYAFATLKDYKLTEADDKDPDLYDRVIALREKNPDLKVSIFSVFIHLLLKENKNNFNGDLFKYTFRFFWQLVVGLSDQLHLKNLQETLSV